MACNEWHFCQDRNSGNRKALKVERTRRLVLDWLCLEADTAGKWGGGGGHGEWAGGGAGAGAQVSPTPAGSDHTVPRNVTPPEATADTPGRNAGRWMRRAAVGTDVGAGGVPDRKPLASSCRHGAAQLSPPLRVGTTEPALGPQRTCRPLPKRTCLL